MNLQRHLRTAHPSVQLEESVPSLLQLPSTDPGQVSCFEQSTSAAASTDLPKTAGILQPSVTQTKNKHITEQMTAAKHKGGDDEDDSQWRAIFYCGGQNI